MVIGADVLLYDVCELEDRGSNRPVDIHQSYVVWLLLDPACDGV